jgi:hypothetical protein
LTFDPTLKRIEGMNIRRTALAALAALSIAAPAFAQEKSPAPSQAKAPASTQPSDDDMAKMMALAQPGENHKVLALLSGNWNYQLKYWMIPGAPPTESSGTSTYKPLMGGRYFQNEASGTFHMPGPDGQLHDMEFKGMSIDAYDNVKQKFVSSWIDNMGTSIVILEGTYDPASKTLTYYTEEEMMPGVKTKAKQTIKFLDHDHYVLDWYEKRGGEEAKTMEINYTRQA